MDLTDSLDHDELTLLAQRWGNTPSECHTLGVDHPFLSGKDQLITSNKRRAEICYVMHRGDLTSGDPAAGVLLHTKTYYPRDVYRLPTGGIHEGEAVEETLAREIYEETGMRVGAGADHVVVQDYLGVVAYEFDHPRLAQKDRFATYHFLVQMPESGTIVTLDPEEQIGGWLWTPVDQLGAVAEKLESTHRDSARWADWGRFRALSHRFVAARLAHYLA